MIKIIRNLLTIILIILLILLGDKNISKAIVQNLEVNILENGNLVTDNRLLLQNLRKW